MDTKYSLTTLLNDLLRLQNNGYQIISKLSDVVSSNSDTVDIPVNEGNGVVKTVTVPSFGALKNQMVRLENNIKSLSGVGDIDSSIQLSDGTFRKILVSNLQREAADITNMAVPKSFATRENWFFESFLNPLLYVKFDLSNQIKYNTENVEVSRYILNLDTEDKKTIFKNQFLNKDDLKYQAFAKILLDNNISYFLDKDVTAVPPRTLRLWGNFSVLKITDDTVSDTVDNVNYQKRVLRVTLDKLNYNDTTSEFLGTLSLKVGDSLVVNSGRKNTRYEIVGVETATRIVSLRLVEGFDAIRIGGSILSYFAKDDSSVEVDVNIGFNEYCVIFIKGIDPDSKISAVNWSPGVGVYTNDLTIKDENDETITLAKYYQNEVVDFGAYLYSIAKDGVIPSTLGLTPDAPQLAKDNFKVLQINKHVTDTSSLSDLKKLQSDKLRVQSTITGLDKSISSLRSKIQTTRYSTKQVEETDRSELANLIEQKDSQSSLFSSIIDDINKIGTSTSVADLTPKYRVRGFFPMPAAKTSDRTAPQEVVQFVIQSRYLSKDGGANQPDQITFTDNNGAVRRGTFSTWSEIKTEVRKRITDPKTGNTTWVIEDVENADAVNINCVDIPISFGEAIEFRIKSLSESGWPVSPLESDWSSLIMIDFPSEFESTPDINSILNEAKNEKVRIELQNELQTLGIPKHVANSFEQGGKYYAHPSLEIASGFLTSEQNVISLFDKLISLDNQLTSIRSLIEATRGVLVVKIVDEAGLEYPVTQNTTVKLFAGNYRDQVSALPIQKGVIVTKNYFVKLGNDSASNLELYARFWGSKNSIAQPSYTAGTAFPSPYNANDPDYNSVRRYDYVPMALSNPSSDDVSSKYFVKFYPEASSQVLGQFIQSRYVSVDGTQNLYGKVLGATYGVYSSRNQIDPITYPTPSIAAAFWEVEYNSNQAILDNISNLGAIGSTASGDFIWRGATGATTVLDVVPSTDPYVTNFYDDTIFLHVNHPSLDYFITQPLPNNVAGYSIRNSIFSNVPTGSTGSALQTPLFMTQPFTIGNTTNKIGFEPNDQYLIGPRSTGAYLFLNPNSHNDVVVDGSDALSIRQITFGDSNTISIPVTFQYRMTDYFGDGDNGIGNVAGKRTFTRSENLTYTKTIGLDVYANPLNKERFSFDLQVSARYFSKTIGTKDIPTKTFESALDDLNQTIKTIRPTTSRSKTVTKYDNLGGSDGNSSNRT